MLKINTKVEKNEGFGKLVDRFVEIVAKNKMGNRVGEFVSGAVETSTKSKNK